MTIIVYDGESLYADRKCYYDGRHAYESIKLKKVVTANTTLFYAFSGSFADCAIGENVVESNFDPEVCRWAYERLGHDNLQDAFDGIVVEVFADGSHNVYLVNYAGDKCQMLPNQVVAVGAKSEDLLLVTRTIKTFGTSNGVPMHEIIRFTFAGSNLTQQDFIIDSVNLRTGIYEEV